MNESKKYINDKEIKIIENILNYKYKINESLKTINEIINFIINESFDDPIINKLLKKFFYQYFTSKTTNHYIYSLIHIYKIGIEDIESYIKNNIDYDDNDEEFFIIANYFYELDNDFYKNKYLSIRDFNKVYKKTLFRSYLQKKMHYDDLISNNICALEFRPFKQKSIVLENKSFNYVQNNGTIYEAVAKQLFTFTTHSLGTLPTTSYYFLNSSIIIEDLEHGVSIHKFTNFKAFYDAYYLIGDIHVEVPKSHILIEEEKFFQRNDIYDIAEINREVYIMHENIKIGKLNSKLYAFIDENELLVLDRRIGKIKKINNPFILNYNSSISLITDISLDNPIKFSIYSEISTDAITFLKYKKITDDAVIIRVGENILNRPIYLFQNYTLFILDKKRTYVSYPEKIYIKKTQYGYILVLDDSEKPNKWYIPFYFITDRSGKIINLQPYIKKKITLSGDSITKEPLILANDSIIGKVTNERRVYSHKDLFENIDISHLNGSISTITTDKDFYVLDLINIELENIDHIEPFPNNDTYPSLGNIDDSNNSSLQIKYENFTTSTSIDDINNFINNSTNEPSFIDVYNNSVNLSEINRNDNDTNFESSGNSQSSNEYENNQTFESSGNSQLSDDYENITSISVLNEDNQNFGSGDYPSMYEYENSTQRIDNDNNKTNFKGDFISQQSASSIISICMMSFSIIFIIVILILIIIKRKKKNASNRI